MPPFFWCWVLLRMYVRMIRCGLPAAFIHLSIYSKADESRRLHVVQCLHAHCISCALVLEAKVFPAGVGLDSASKDATYYSTCLRDSAGRVETRRRFGWLRIVIHQVRLCRAPIWVSSGGVNRGKPGMEQHHAQAYRGTIYRASKHQIRRGRREAPSSTSQGSAEPLCARIKGANREVPFLREKLISDHGRLSSYEGQQGAANGQDSRGIFSGMQRALDGWMLLARAPASPVQGLHRHGPQYFNFLGGLRNLGLFDQN